MKKVLFILISIMLVLSMSGLVSAETAQPKSTPITESDLSDVDNGLGTSTSDTKVTLSLEQSFEVTIPDNFDLTESLDDSNQIQYTGLAVVTADVHLLNSGNKLTVSVASTQNGEHSVDSRSNNYWVLQKEGDTSSTLRYIIRASETDTAHAKKTESFYWLAEGENFITVPGQGKITRYLHFLLYDPVASVGKYTDTLTFTVTVASTP